MADYNPPPDERLSAGKAVLATDTRAIRDLAAAVAEGAAGAPPVQVVAMQAPSAGLGYTLRRLLGATTERGTSETFYADYEWDVYRNFVLHCVSDGVIQVHTLAKVSSANFGSYRILRDDTVIREEVLGVNYVGYVTQVTISYGQTLQLQLKATNSLATSAWKDVYITSTTPSIALV